MVGLNLASWSAHHPSQKNPLLNGREIDLSSFSISPTEDRFLTSIKYGLRSVFSDRVGIDGLGIEVTRSSKPDPVHDLIKARELARQSQVGVDWKARLETGALISRLSLDSQGLEEASNKDKVKYLKSFAKPGDVIFVTGGGKQQGPFSELIDLVTRLVSSQQVSEFSFPFTHCMVNLGDGSILDLSPTGVRRRTWEQVFLENNYYDCIAIGSLRCSDSERKEFVKKAQEVSAVLTDYNYAWVFLRAPIEVRRDRTEVKDTSVDGKSGVCTDIITEAAKALAPHHPRFAQLEGADPFELFKCSFLTIVGAVNFQRES